MEVQAQCFFHKIFRHAKALRQFPHLAAAALQCRTLPLINALFSEVNPIPAKAAVSAMGFGEEYLRMPLSYLEDGHRATLLAEMKKLGVLK